MCLMACWFVLVAIMRGPLVRSRGGSEGDGAVEEDKGEEDEDKEEEVEGDDHAMNHSLSRLSCLEVKVPRFI